MNNNNLSIQLIYENYDSWTFYKSFNILALHGLIMHACYIVFIIPYIILFNYITKSFLMWDVKDSKSVW